MQESESLDIAAEKHHLTPEIVLRCLRQQITKTTKMFFKDTLKIAFVKCGTTLQTKMPLDKIALQICSALDPTTRGTSIAMELLMKIPSVTNLVPKGDEQKFTAEARHYSSDRKLNRNDTRVPVVEWWANLSVEQYPTLTRAAKGLLSCFHGPLVESSFSVMSYLMNEGKCSMDIETYAAMQTVKYALLAKDKTSIQMFNKKNPNKEPVNKKLINFMSTAWSRNQDRKETNKRKRVDKETEMGAPAAKVPTKISETERLVKECHQANLFVRSSSGPLENTSTSLAIPSTSTSLDCAEELMGKDTENLRKKKTKQSDIMSFFKL